MYYLGIQQSHPHQRPENTIYYNNIIQIQKPVIKICSQNMKVLIANNVLNLNKYQNYGMKITFGFGPDGSSGL